MAATAYFNKFPSYCRMVAHAKSVANRSVLIDHCGLKHIDIPAELDNVEQVYSIEKESQRGISRLSLIEFKSNEDADLVMKQTRHNDGLLPVPMKILLYNTRLGSSPPPPPSDLPYQMDHVKLDLDKNWSQAFESYSELLSNSMMSLVALKLRFVTLTNLERILCSGVYGEYELMPFGSSVTDMGCNSGDLDLIFIRKTNHYNAIINKNYKKSAHDEQRHQYEPIPSQPLSPLSSKLVHIDRSLYFEPMDHNQLRGTMRWIDTTLKEYMPLSSGSRVLNIQFAKVPIIKFTSRITDIDCDLSFDLGLKNSYNDINAIQINDGILMTEILYSLCRNNNLIAALVIYLKMFAKVAEITSKKPGIGMTNFQYLSTVIFFLQQTNVDRLSSSLGHDQDAGNLDSAHHPRSDYKPSRLSQDGRFSIRKARSNELPAIIPPFRDLVDGDFLLNSKEPVHYDDEELNQILPALIINYFEFYSKFDFNKCSLNLYESTSPKKLDNSTMFVLNPIDKTKNICHNVNRKGLDRLVREVKLASTTSCPLSLLRHMMRKYERQATKNRSLSSKLVKADDVFSSEEILQDACR